jgi:signal transduction histidine kinase
MNLRAKLFPALVAACVAVLVLLCLAQYRRSSRAAEESLRADVEGRAHRFGRAVESQHDGRINELFDLAYAPELDKFWVRGATSDRTRSTASMQPGGEVPVPEDLIRVVRKFFGRADKVYSAVSFVTGPLNNVVVRFEPPSAEGAAPIIKSGEFTLSGKGFQELISNAVDEHTPLGVVKRANTRQSSIIYVVQVVWQLEGHVGYLVAELRTDALAALAAEESGDAREVSAGRLPFQMIVLDRAGRILYHTNAALKFQNANTTPQLAALASEMSAGRAGARSFDGADGARWLAAYEPVQSLDLSVAVAANETAATAALRREGRVYVALAFMVALAAVGLVLVRERRASRRIERVARAAQAVAAGNLDERLEVSAHDRTRPIAESFNLMTDRLREHIRRESENRQFQAFMRLSAMLTHDLKNAITGLSMLVSNMERQWEREEFRADAVTSLREATDKLRGLVARLSKPVETLSGEYRGALRPVDLVPVIRRVVEGARVRAQFHEIEARLPDSLEATVDAERVERVVENLVINALEAMGRNAGRLTVEAGQEGAGEIFIAVTDTGPGMSQEFVRAKLFQPFATTKTQGLGLGLYTCREVVEAHGGRIEVESRRSSGTRFRVVLPSRPVSLPRPAKSDSLKK